MIASLPEQLRQRRFSVELEPETQRYILKWRRSPGYQGMIYLVLTLSVIALAWVVWRCFTPGAPVKEPLHFSSKSAPATDKEHEPQSAAADGKKDGGARAKNFKPLVAGLALLVMLGLLYGAFRRFEVLIGNKYFAKRVRWFFWGHAKELRPEEPCIIKYIDDGNNNGHYCVNAQSVSGPVLPWLVKPSDTDGAKKWVILWYAKDKESAEQLQQWLNTVREELNQSGPAFGG